MVEVTKTLLEHAQNIKISLFLFIQRLEREGESMDWPQVLETFTSICGQINTLMRYARDKSQFFENTVVLPLHLSPERDEELAKLTEGRVFMVNHEMVPDYLRTKPDPEIEELEKNVEAKTKSIGPEAAVKQVNAMMKLVDSIVNQIKTHSERTSSEMSRLSIKPSYAQADTNELIMAVSMGRGLTMPVLPHRGGGAHPDTPIGPRPEPVRQQPMQRQNVRAPELKTNIKTGPY